MLPPLTKMLDRLTPQEKRRVNCKEGEGGRDEKAPIWAQDQWVLGGPVSPKSVFGEGCTIQALVLLQMKQGPWHVKLDLVGNWTSSDLDGQSEKGAVGNYYGGGRIRGVDSLSFWFQS